MKRLVVALLVLSASTAARANERGIDIGFGIGPSFGGLGASVGYALGVGSLAHVMPYAGAGLNVRNNQGWNDDAALNVGLAGGLLLSVGHRHRLVLDLTYGMLGYEYFYLHGISFSRTVWGPSTLVGYAFASKNGFLVRAELGPSFRVAPYGPERDHVDLNVTLALGKTF